MVEGTESCDAGDAFPYDGCSATCQREPDCTAGACNSECGDYLVIGEDCDDGNERDGDGCSSTCTIERGFNCASGGPLAHTMTVPIVYRDFRSHNDPFHGHPNFHHPGLPTATTGIVKLKVDAEGKPEYAGVGDWQVGSQTNFATWYRPSSFSLAFAEITDSDSHLSEVHVRGHHLFPAGWPRLGGGRDQPRDALRGRGRESQFLFHQRGALLGEVRSRGERDVVLPRGRRRLGLRRRQLVTDLGGIHDAVTGGFTLNAQTADTQGTRST